jgi:hypothetical protein
MTQIAGRSVVLAVLLCCSSRSASPRADDGVRRDDTPAMADARKDPTTMTTPGQTPPAQPTTPMTTLERLQAWAGPGFGINPWHDVKVPDVELYYAANTVEFRGVAVVVGSKPPPFAPLTGAEGFRACVAHGISDPAQLASLALLFFAAGGKPVVVGTAAKHDTPAVQRLVHAPAVDHGTLEFWGLDQRGELLIRHRLDLAALHLESQAGQALVTASRNPIDVAVEQLAGASSSLYMGAIDALVAACKDPRAATALDNVIARHRDSEARRWAAFQAHACHGANTVSVLIAALEKDADAPVRKAAADSLGKLAAKPARAALERAQHDPDPDVAGAAGRALKKL